MNVNQIKKIELKLDRDNLNDNFKGEFIVVTNDDKKFGRKLETSFIDYSIGNVIDRLIENTKE